MTKTTQGGKPMLSAIISVFSNFIHLILGINTPQKFPPPLSAEQERDYFQSGAYTAQSASCISYRPQILRLMQKSGRSCVHRYYRTYKGGRHIPNLQRRKVCHLRRKMYSKCYPIITELFEAYETSHAPFDKKFLYNFKK